MKNFKIVNSQYWEEEENPTSSMAFCEVETNLGFFNAIAIVAPEDDDIANAWDGLSFAEAKCYIAYLKEKAKLYRERAKGAENAYKALLQNHSPEEPFMTELNRQVWVAKRDANKLKERYKRLRGNYKEWTQNTLDERRKLRKTIEEMKLSESE